MLTYKRRRRHEDVNDSHRRVKKCVVIVHAENGSIHGTICQPRLAAHRNQPFLFILFIICGLLILRFVPVKPTANFSQLPYELVVEIAKRLKLLQDFTCFTSLSRSLHLCVEEEYCFEGLRFRKSLPYLMLPPPVSSSSCSRDGNVQHQFYSLIEGESIVASLKFPAFKTTSKMCFESLGWLLTLQVDGSMSLLDPFSDTQIPLPHLHTIPLLERIGIDKRLLVQKMVLSSRPNENSDFILMVIIGHHNDLAFWRLGDKAWNDIDGQIGKFNDVVYGGDGQFYAINFQGVIVINLAADAAGHMHVDYRRVIVDGGSVLTPLYGQNLYILKAINGSVLVIKRCKENKFLLTGEFQVYDIEIETGKSTQIYSLGSMAVFLGFNSSFAVDSGTAPNRGVIKANHIYFTDDFSFFQYVYFKTGMRQSFTQALFPDAKGGNLDSGVFNFQTGDIELVYPVEPTNDVPSAIWITPNLRF